MDREHFFSPRSRYYGLITPENLAFNAALQEFSRRVGYIANLQTGGKLSPLDAYQQIEQLISQLDQPRV